MASQLLIANLVCNGFDKNIIHGWKFLVVSNHFVMVEYKFREFVVVYFGFFFNANIYKFVIWFLG